METIINKHTEGFNLLENYKYFIIKNVIKYNFIPFDKYHIISDDKNNCKDYYLILDFTFSGALFHWIAECAIYFKLFLKFKEQYPYIKMVFLTERGYHKTIGDYFNIKENDYVYSLPENNNCIFTLPISALNDNYINEDYKLYANDFIKNINGNIDKTIELLILPRQKKENYNHRINNCDDIINNLKNAIILNTDYITDFNIQIQTIKSSKIIIVTDGSSFLLNGLIAKNSKIIVLGDVVIGQSIQQPKLKYYLDLIKENNEVIFIPYSNGGFYNNKFLYDDIKDVLI